MFQSRLAIARAVHHQVRCGEPVSPCDKTSRLSVALATDYAANASGLCFLCALVKRLPASVTLAARNLFARDDVVAVLFGVGRFAARAGRPIAAR